jgi:hypothetical protein
MLLGPEETPVLGFSWCGCSRPDRLTHSPCCCCCGVGVVVVVVGWGVVVC